jgi:hypothetical protein
MHALLQPPAEEAHVLSPEGEQRVAQDPELCPGHDCCAVCAGPAPDAAALLDCPQCASGEVVRSTAGRRRVPLLTGTGQRLNGASETVCFSAVAYCCEAHRAEDAVEAHRAVCAILSLLRRARQLAADRAEQERSHETARVGGKALGSKCVRVPGGDATGWADVADEGYRHLLANEVPDDADGKRAAVRPAKR